MINKIIEYGFFGRISAAGSYTLWESLTIAPRLRNYLPYEKAKKFVHRLKLKSNAEWIQYINGGEKTILRFDIEEDRRLC